MNRYKKYHKLTKYDSIKLFKVKINFVFSNDWLKQTQELGAKWSLMCISPHNILVITYSLLFDCYTQFKLVKSYIQKLFY